MDVAVANVITFSALTCGVATLRPDEHISSHVVSLSQVAVSHMGLV